MPRASRGGGVAARGRDADAAGTATVSAAATQEQIIARRFIYNPLTTARARSCSDGRYVSWYSGPSPPSGGVSRPPLAVIAPHCTQLV